MPKATDESPAARLARLERVPQVRRWVRAGDGPDPPPIDASFDLPDPPQLLLDDYAWLLRVAKAALAVDEERRWFSFELEPMPGGLGCTVCSGSGPKPREIAHDSDCVLAVLRRALAAEESDHGPG